MENDDNSFQFRVFSKLDANSERTFERLYRASYADVYNSVYYRVLNREIACDVTADAFLRAARYFDRFDPQRAQFGTWVKSIARNCLGDYFRKNRPTTAIEDAPESALAVGDDFSKQTADADLVRTLLAALDEDDRTLVFMKYYEGKRNKEIADELNLNASTVASRLQRALRKMRAAAH